MVRTQNSLPVLLNYTLGGCLLIFLLLQVWRPYYFLTDDNLSGNYPALTEMGRDVKNGEWPFVSKYLFGGHYDWSRDLACLCWHPFYLLPALLADTSFRFCMLDLIALQYLLFNTVGFTLLVHRLREQYELKLPDSLAIFYTLSFIYCLYILTIGPSWINFLGSQGALPWLTYGIIDRKMFRGVAIVTLITIHQFVGSYAGMTVSNSLVLTLFALGLAACEKSPRALFIWCAGSLLGYLILSPFLLHVLDGYAHSLRLKGLSPIRTLAFAIPVTTIPFSFFLGSWTEPMTMLNGDWTLRSFTFPYSSTLFACAAAWCLIPALGGPRPWRPIEKLCLVLACIVLLFVVRPYLLAVISLNVPVLKGLRWPFRETLQCLFFIHLFIILRPLHPNIKIRWLVAGYSLAMFVLPLPFLAAPTFNALALDRQALFSGDGERFWDQVKQRLKPGDEVATIVDWDMWLKEPSAIPYTYLGTANFPALYRIPCISGYSTTAPTDRLPLQTAASFWYGAFSPDQVDEILQQRPDLKLIELKRIRPLKIVLYSKGEPPVDISPVLHN